MTGYATLDVFTDRRFGGNPLAVIPDARALDPQDFQRIAREFNYSETAFVLPPDDPANDARVRIFTPNEEMPFAGHPNVGTAFALGVAGTVLGRPVGDALRFEELAGLVAVRLQRSAGAVIGASVRAPRRLAEGPLRTPETVAGLAGIDATAVLGDTHPPCYASVGAGFLFAEVAGEALAAASPRHDRFAAEAGRLHAEGVADTLPALFLWTRDGQSAGRMGLRARMFAPLSGIVEDPATGSAAAALGALLAARGIAQHFLIRQGMEMGRASGIFVDTGDDGVWVGGACAMMFEGQMLP